MMRQSEIADETEQKSLIGDERTQPGEGSEADPIRFGSAANKRHDDRRLIAIRDGHLDGFATVTGQILIGRPNADRVSLR